MAYGSLWFVIPMIIGPALGVVSAILTAFLTYNTTRRGASGSVQTSNASELWAENDRIITRLIKEVDRTSIELTHVTTERDALRLEGARLHEEASHLKSQMVENAAEIAVLRFKLTGGSPPVQDGAHAPEAHP